MGTSARDTAHARAAALAAHVAPALARHDAAASEARPTPGGGAGTLTVKDSRTGKEYVVPVDEHGSVKATDFKKITAGGDGVGIRLYDPGYMNTAPCKSAISYIDGDKGILRYRGYPIEQLAEHSTYPETAYLLLYGDLPTATQLAEWEEVLLRYSALPAGLVQSLEALPHDAHPMGVLVTGLAALGAFHPEANPAIAGNSVYNSMDVRDKQIVRILAKVPMLAAYAYHRRTGRPVAPPNPRLSYTENFLYMLDAGLDLTHRPNPRFARALDIMFLLHAEHEMNCSTAASRHLASSGVDVYTTVAGAVGALYGPLHGGANEAVLRMLERIGSVENIPRFIDGVKARQEKLFGFGHRVYKNFDPRAKVIRNVAEEVFKIAGHDPMIEVATALEKAAREDEYFVKRKLYPNVDFYSGLVYRALGFPPGFFTVLFSVPRCTGYLAHWRESLDDNDARIMRPQQLYTGEWLRDYAPPGGREPGPDGFTGAAPSNAARRRLAGNA